MKVILNSKINIGNNVVNLNMNGAKVQRLNGALEFKTPCHSVVKKYFTKNILI